MACPSTLNLGTMPLINLFSKRNLNLDVISPYWLNLEATCPFAQRSFKHFSPWWDQFKWLALSQRSPKEFYPLVWSNYLIDAHYGNFLDVKYLFANKIVHFEDDNSNAMLMSLLKIHVFLLKWYCDIQRINHWLGCHININTYDKKIFRSQF